MAAESNQTDSSQVLARVFDKTTNSLRSAQADDIENMDEAGGGITYYGFARPGTAELSPGWRIYRKEIIGTVTRIRWANGDSTYSNIWVNRASLTYT